MTSFQTIDPVSIGTGVAKTTLGTVNKPSESQCLIEFTPYQCPVITTTAESLLTETAIESQSVIDILPKRVINAPVQAGLGATYASMVPILNAFECNTPLQAGSNDIITGFGQAQVANTSAPLQGIEFHFSDSAPSMAQMYYDKPNNETSTGTSATTVAGNSITINGGRTLKNLYGEVASSTPVASKPIIGSFIFSSNNFDSSQGLQIAGQPVAQGLGSTISTLQPKNNQRRNVNMGMKSTCTINTSYVVGSAVTTASTFICGIGYTKV